MSALHWEKIGKIPHHGVQVMLSALRTHQSCGIGEFLDLIPLCDWCRSNGFDCLQLLPINDSDDDPSPYNPISSVALDPIYLSLRELGISASFNELNKLQRVDKKAVRKQKMALLFDYFLSSGRPNQKFTEEHPWVTNYALFKALKERFDGSHWKNWPEQYQSPTQKALEENKEKVDFYIFLQYHCFAQMEKVYAHASLCHFLIQGDLPILLSKNSADVWSERSMFCLEFEAGAPPDLYNIEGQKWGFPLFDWDAMKKDGYLWWKRRLSVAEKFYHLYRIDHVVGFFRIWATLPDAKASDGFFIPEDPTLWEEQGKERLSMLLASSSMLPMGEDLGTVPSWLPLVLKELGICGTKVVRWQRNWNGDRSYIPFSDYEPLSLTTLSTPDMDTLEGWWRNFPNEAIAFAHFKNWSYCPVLSFKQRCEILRDAHHTSSLFHINLLQEYLALFPDLVWPKTEDERINIPGTVLASNWTYRYRPFLEEIISHKGLSEILEHNERLF